MEAWLRLNPPKRSQYRSPRRAKHTGCTVVHTAENLMDELDIDTGAEGVANFIRNRTDPGSYHDLVDSDSNIKLVRYSDEAFQDGTGSNPWAMSISFAVRAADWGRMSAERRDALLWQGALAFARQQDWLARNKKPTTPLRRITKAQSDAGLAGFISHGERDPGRRSDPGIDFPWERFFSACKAAVEGTTWNPARPQKKEITMFLVDEPETNRQLLCDAHTYRHVKTGEEYNALLDMGIPSWSEKPETVVIRRALLAARKEVT